MNTTFDDAAWRSGTAPFGHNETRVKTLWKSRNLWIRRSFTIGDTSFNKLFPKISHDDDEVYLNVEEIFKRK